MSYSVPPVMVSAWRARTVARKEAERAHREALRALLPAVVQILVARFDARRVVLFGSLASGEARLDSDVDLLVEGVPLDRLGDAHVAILDAMPGAWIDLVPAERALPEVLIRARRDGELLHGE